MRELGYAVYVKLVDIRSDDFSEVLAPGDYSSSQAFARQHSKGGKDGIAYPAVRLPAASALCPSGPMSPQSLCRGEISYHWHGERIEAQGEIPAEDLISRPLVDINPIDRGCG